jgi:hypothetical protein
MDFSPFLLCQASEITHEKNNITNSKTTLLEGG